QTIDAVPSISRDFVSTLSIDPKILVDTSVARGPAVSMAGQNFRFNSVTIDGVAQNDNFGLSKNASATQRSPISIDAIEAINVNLAPFDVTYGNFIGGNINIVTKSGTNEFHGSVYGFTTGDSLTGNTTEGGRKLGIGDFDEDTYGFTLGGPVVKDKLFFFANYEKFKTTLPSNSQTIDSIAGVTQANVDEVIGIFNTVYGFDPGRFAATDTDQDEKLLLKLDWYIDDNHRAVGTYQVADGDVLFDDFPEVAVLQSNRYNINERLDAFSLQAFSTWSDVFSTEVKIGFKDVENRQISVNPNTPDFAVTTPGGGTITAGGDRFRHSNELDNKSRLIRIKGDYDLGAHTLTAGFEQEKYTVRNLFLPFSKGNYVFGSINDLRNRDVNFVLYGNSNTGVAGDAEANFDLTVNSIYLQDEWMPTDELTLKFGLRYDKVSNDDPIKTNADFMARRGFSNTENLDGKDMVLPRVGFNWTPTDRLTVRGGAGLFGGGTPLIMLSNSYAGDGVSRTFASFIPSFGPDAPPVSTAVAALPDPTAAFTNFQGLIGVSPIAQTDAISPDFELLRTWKYSIGADYVADLSRFGMGDDWNVSLEAILSNVAEGYDVFEARRRQAGTAPDGRPIYDLPADADYIVRNTSRGGGGIYTLDISKTVDTGYGTFFGTLGYTYQDVTEVRSYNRFVIFETLAMDPQTDLNNPQEAASRYEVRHRISATLNWQKELFGDNLTSASLVYSGRSGRHYSHVFGSAGMPTFGGNFLADFGSEGDNPGSQLFYVPTGPNDPIIMGDPTFLANLNAYIDSEPCLRDRRGAIVPRNACRTDWINSLNLRIAQEVGIGSGEKKLEFTLDVENLLNLLNEDWGRVNSYTAPSNVAVANVALAPGGAQYILSPTSAAVTGPSTVVSRPAIARLPSVYRVQLGIRFRF
ncbi:MAG: TonB-dependent receptor, partial [Gammaproteobacteria bacterium]|nr:TonB-dependent receptor [Gammaproteobacteria bacterium]